MIVRIFFVVPLFYLAGAAFAAVKVLQVGEVSQLSLEEEKLSPGGLRVRQVWYLQLNQLTATNKANWAWSSFACLRNAIIALFVFGLAVAFSVTLGPTIRAQSPSAPSQAAKPCPSTATLDQLITAIDAAVSGPGNQDRSCFRALFLPDARLIPVRIAADGTATPHILNVDGWIEAVAKRGSTSFIEHQVKVKTDTWAHIAHLWSTYETHAAPEVGATEGKLMDRGINSIQAINDGKQWKIIEITWQAQTPTDPVPAQYLP